MYDPKKIFRQGVAYGVLFTLIIIATMNVLFQGFIEGKVVDAKTEIKLKTISKMVNHKFLYADEVDEEAIQDGILAGYMYGLGDPYADYYGKAEAKSVIESTEGQFGGIGVIVTQNTMTFETVITEVTEDSPGEKVGLKVGDILYKVNGTDVTSMPLDEIVKIIQGEIGTDVEVSVLRGKNKEEVKNTITRALVKVKSVDYEMKDGNVGYISISTFDLETVEQFKKAVNELKDKGMKSLIIDLRDNPGGELTSVCDVCDYILPEGKIMTVKYKSGKDQTFTSNNKDVLNIPMVVLVNENSASASEVFTGAMKDHGIATIVGTTTYGKGSVQELYSLNDGTIFKFTVAEYRLPSGVSINKKGIKPDVEVERKYNLEDLDYDNQLEKAIEVAKEKIKK